LARLTQHQRELLDRGGTTTPPPGFPEIGNWPPFRRVVDTPLCTSPGPVPSSGVSWSGLSVAWSGVPSPRSWR